MGHQKLSSRLHVGVLENAQAVNEKLLMLLITEYIIIKCPDINPFHPNISLHILLTVLYTFPKVLTRRICLIIKRFPSW